MKSQKTFNYLCVLVFTSLIISCNVLWQQDYVAAALDQDMGAISSAPPLISYQGTIISGNTPYEGTGYFKFALVNSATGNGSSNFWANDGTASDAPSTAIELSVTGGQFHVLLGDIALDGMTQPLSPAAFRETAIYLRIWFSSTGADSTFEALEPNQMIVTVPYAFHADNALALNAPNGGPPNAVHIADNGDVGVGTTQPSRKLHVIGNAIQLENNSKVIELRTDGRAVDLQSFTHSLFIRSTGTGVCPWECNNVIISPFGQDGNVGIGTIDPGINNGDQRNNIKLDVSGRVRLRRGNSSWDPVVTFYDDTLQKDRGGVGMGWNYSKIGLYADGVGWGFLMDAQNGNVGIGTTDPQAKLDVAGMASTQLLKITGGSDLAEPFEITGDESIEPGMVVSIDPEHPGQLRISDTAYDRTVAGVVSGAGGVNPGLTMYQEGTVADGSHPIALTGRVYVLADASHTPIRPGDLLTASNNPGHAMKVTNYENGQGATLGKAMSSLEEGTGLVLLLVALQ